VMDSAKQNAISVQGLTKAYKLYPSSRDRMLEAFSLTGKSRHSLFNAIEDISLDIPRGCTTGIVGRNGSGKSTLLQCICGIVSPTAGSVDVQGRIAALLELGAGFNPDFTGRENIGINGAILGLEAEQIERRTDDILAFADIGDYIDQPVRTYSSGMFVRLAFAIAINVDPDILVVDEALAVGDIHFQARCYERFHQFREQGVTVVFVTHDLNMVTRYCDQAFLLDKGRIVARGEPRKVVGTYRRREVGHEDEDGDAESGTKPNPFEENPLEIRYGDDGARIVEGGIYDLDGEPVQTLDSGETYRIRMQVKFERDIESPVFAFTIKDARGTELAGTNTEFSNVSTGNWLAGETATIEFSQRIDLNAGQYLLSLGCVDLSGGELKIYDRRHDFLAFQVITDRAIVGLVDLHSEVSIRR